MKQKETYVSYISPLGGEHDVVVLVHHIGVGAQEEKVVALLHGSESGARYDHAARALEALDRRAHRGLELKNLLSRMQYEYTVRLEHNANTIFEI